MKVRYLIASLAVLLGVFSCDKDENFEPGAPTPDSSSTVQPGRTPSEEVRHVMVMVAGGYNSLYSYMSEDMRMLEEGYLPTGTYRSADVLVVLSRFTAAYQDYTTPSAPVLYRMYRDPQGRTVKDTLKVWNGDTQIFGGNTLTEALDLVYKRYPAKGYGMVVSSHASGWLPEGYYNDPSKYEKSSLDLFSARRSSRAWTYTPGCFPPLDPYPAVKSIGQDNDSDLVGVEMDLDEFVSAIPMHLDYLLIDACLSGCVEVAYALREKADIVGFSQTEILADGFDYKTITEHLLQPEPDPVAVCQDYFNYYDSQSGSNRSATISVIDTRKMDALSEVCATLFEKYRSQISSLNGYRVQGYFRHERHFFYDLRDILVKAGITEEETAALDDALAECVLYKAATPYFLSLPIRTACGLSMYLPSMGSSYLDNFYRTRITWNQATKLVQ